MINKIVSLRARRSLPRDVRGRRQILRWNLQPAMSQAETVCGWGRLPAAGDLWYREQEYGTCKGIMLSL